MNYYPKTLRTLIGIIKPENVLKIFSQIMDGVEAAHLVGVWHRDLKPENILWDEVNNKIILADFGIAHFEEEEIYTAVETKAAARMANFLYSAPEQRIRDKKVDKRADIFSLGLILNELFTHEVIHGAGYKKIGDVANNYVYLDDIVEKLIQKSPDNRFSLIEEIKKELIGRKNEFVATQKYDEARHKVVKQSEAPTFDPISINNLDYNNGTLRLELNKNVPAGWTQEFQNPRDGHGSLLGYGPEYFTIRGNLLTISVREDENLIQQIVNYAKQYVDAANRGYIMKIQELAQQELRRQKAALEKEVNEAQLRKNILSKVKL